MELSWSTFVLEVINFLVLLWILKRFLYQPVMDIIERRRNAIEQTRCEAEARAEQAEKLRQQYENRLSDWNNERQQARAAMLSELEAERARQMDVLNGELEKERQKLRVADARRQSDMQRQAEEIALELAGKFATRLLQQAAGKETHDRLLELVINELSQLPTERMEAIRGNHGAVSTEIRVQCAYALSDDQHQRLHRALVDLFGQDRDLHIEHKRDLLAGVRITVGAWVLGANLQDELKGMNDMAYSD